MLIKSARPEGIPLKCHCVCLSTALASLLLVSPVLPAQENAKQLTVEGLFSHTDVLGSPPEGLAWSPDAQHLTYLDGGELIDLDPGLRKPHVLVSHAKLATLVGGKETEQDRDHRERYGMANYLWAPDSKHLLFDSNGSLWIYNLANGTGIGIGFSGEGSGDDPKFSPNGEYISFVRNHGLAVVPLREAGTPTVMTAAAPNPATLNGEVDWVYEEELDTKSNYFWSPDSKNLAFLQMIEADVPEYPIPDWIPTHATLDKQRYPQPGDLNPDVRVGVVSVKGHKVSWVHVPIEQGQDYIPRFGWVDHKTLWVETLSRDQKHRRIYFADPGTGTAHSVLEISDEKFVDENFDVYVGHGCIVLSNWTDGHNHLYLYKYDEGRTDSAIATLDKQLTKGEFEVGQVYRVDPERKNIYYASHEGSPLEQQVWQVTFDGERKQLTTGAGNHDANFAPLGGSFTDKHSSRMEPPVVELCAIGTNCKTFWASHAIEAYGLHAPEQLEIKAHDGTMLYGTLLLPANATSPASVPLIVNPYGGPAVQTVVNQWTDGLLFDELLTQHGFAVLHADNRGMAGRGRDFEEAAYHNFGPVQLEDQLTVMDAVLAKYPQLDRKRLGWWGWSWGGSFTLYALTHSDRFRTGVAVAPVTDWRNYDSIYTERYMSRPVDFPEGYKDFSVVNTAADLKGRILIAHGTGDDNVHFENTVQFLQKLIDKQIPYDLQIFPRKTHSISGPEARIELFTRILAQFEQYLKPVVD
jgi:dipeptidyl-peptidase-4